MSLNGGKPEYPERKNSNLYNEKLGPIQPLPVVLDTYRHTRVIRIDSALDDILSNLHNRRNRLAIGVLLVFHAATWHINTDMAETYIETMMCTFNQRKH